MTATIIDWSALGKVVLYSLVAGVGVTTVFALAILGASRSTDMRRDGAPGLATVYAALALLAVAMSVAAVAYGIVLMTQKS
jgi:hypothetical protein